MGWGRRKDKHDTKEGVRGATGAVGNAVGGVTRTAGNIVGATGRGLGDTVNRTTNTRSGGNVLKDMGNGADKGTHSLSKGIERGSKGRNPRSPWSRLKGSVRT